jgi:transposase InsO family protein
METRILLDTGSQINIISPDLASGLKGLKSLPEPRLATTVDGTPIASGPINSYIEGTLKIGAHQETIALYLATTSSVDIILGIPWHRHHQPEIDYSNQKITYKGPQCDLHQSIAEAILAQPCQPSQPCQPCQPCQPASPPIDLVDSATFALSLREPEAQCYMLRAYGDDGDHPTQVSTLDLGNPEDTKIPDKYLDYADVFSKKSADILPQHRPYDHAIDLEPGSHPPFGPLYSLSEVELKALREWLEENLGKGFIRVSTSPAGAPILFIKKKDGSLRLCVDYRGLNKITIKDRTPLPLIGESIDRLRKARVFTKIDLRGAYNLVRIKEGDEWKTAFRTRYGHFETLVMPFGLTNAPATFQRFMYDVFRDLLDNFVVIYLDDILVYSDNPDRHGDHVRQVLERLRQHKLYAKAEKCEFDKDRCEFLGYIISESGVHMDNNKIKAVLEWPQPTTIRQLQAFLGFANFYRRFISRFSRICAPMTRLLKKDTPFKFGPDQQQAFDTLKDAFRSAPVLGHFDPTKPIHLETDASDFAIAGILSQTGDDGFLHPIAFHSRKMVPAECNYEIYDKELLAIVDSFKIWRHYLEGNPHPIEIFCDHKNLEYFQTSKILSRRQVRWSLLLNAYKYTFHFRPGKRNTKADSFTRRPDYSEGGNAQASKELPQTLLRPLQAAPIQVEEQDIATRIKDGYRTDPDLKPLLPYLHNPRRNRPRELFSRLKHFELDNDGLVLYDGLVYIPKDDHLKATILAQHHDHPTAGHFGRRKTTELLSRNYFWPNFTTFIRDYIRTCDTCQRTKPSRHKPYGPLQPLPIPERPWSSISLDHITDLPPSNGYDSILVVVCRLTKMAHFIPCLSTDTSEDFAHLFEKNIHRLHGLPKDIVSDRGTLFTSNFWRDVCQQLDITRNLSTAFHPQSDGQTERVNAIVEQYLRAYSDYLQTNWASMLSLAEFAYNNTISASTGMTPFYANFGYHPRFHATLKDVPTPAARDHIRHIHDTHAMCRRRLQEAQERYKKFADHHRNPLPDFKEGDPVMLKRTNIRTDRPSDKLDHKHLGPFRIEKKVGRAAYRLVLPATMKIHPTFHASLLEPYHANTLPTRVHTPPPPPIVDDNGDEQWEVSKILRSRIQRGKFQYLVHWTGYGPEDRSWVDANDFDDLDDLVVEFHRTHPQAPVTAQRRASIRSAPLHRA